MKTKDISSLEQEVLGMLPITQAEVWKKLGIGRRDGSHLIAIMLKEDLIEKKKLNNTFLLERRNGTLRKKKPTFSQLLSKDGKFVPCCGCRIDCDPCNCSLLAEWLK